MRSGPQAVPDPRVTELQRRWLFTQAQLLDDPKEAVIEAGRLIDSAMRLVVGTADEQRNRVERKWQTGADVDTDELRSVMQRYRSLFQYVLAADALVGEIEAVRREHKAVAAAQPRSTAPKQAAAEQDGLAEVLHPSRAARFEAEAADQPESTRESRASQWMTGLGTLWNRSQRTRWVAVAALLLLVALPAAYGWWRWQQPDSAETTRQARALTVEPLHYFRPTQSSPAPVPQADQDPGSLVGSETKAVSTSPATAAPSRQLEASRPANGAPTPFVEETPRGAQPADEQSVIRQADREAEPATPESQPASPAGETANLSEAENPQTDSETLAADTDTEPAPQETAQATADRTVAPEQQATPTSLQLSDLSQALPPVVESEPSPAASEPATRPAEASTASAQQDTPNVRQTPPTARQPEPPPEAAEPAVRRGELVPLSDPGVAAPTLVVEPRAEYPEAARRLRRQATVTLRVLVDERGTPSQIQPLGRDAGLGFDEAARAAVARARWQPATKDGVPVKVWIQTAVRFQLDGR